MVTLDLKLKLPETIAEEAKAKGLLDSSAIEGLLREELRRRRVESLFAAADRLAAVPLPPLSASELEAEVRAARARRRASHARPR
ncbi:MAG: hypothetical protein FJ279_26925 [Planctomycetes bacterium]|nr:hypothetical protein [Planctomycetota bacterium]